MLPAPATPRPPAPGPAAPDRLALATVGTGDLAAVRAFVGAACRARGADAATADALVLAVDEVCANVVAHGYRGASPGPLAVEVARDVDEAGHPCLLVSVRDAAPPFDPADAPPPALDAPAAARPIGGLGWHLVRRSVDAVRHARTPAGNVVVLLRRLAAP